jgi:hypothetical protein
MRLYLLANKAAINSQPLSARIQVSRSMATARHRKSGDATGRFGVPSVTSP